MGFWCGFGAFLEFLCCGFVTVLAWRWCCFGVALVWLWLGVGRLGLGRGAGVVLVCAWALGVFSAWLRRGFGVFWFGFGVVLAWRWCDLGVVLAWRWFGFGVALVWFWFGARVWTWCGLG